MTNRKAYSFILKACANVREVVAEFFALRAIARSFRFRDFRYFRGLFAYVDRTGWVGIVEVIACWDVRGSV